jgi:phosphohistidine phosphatase SixA
MEAAWVLMVLTTFEQSSNPGNVLSSIRFRTQQAAQQAADLLQLREGVWTWIIAD